MRRPHLLILVVVVLVVVSLMYAFDGSMQSLSFHRTSGLVMTEGDAGKSVSNGSINKEKIIGGENVENSATTKSKETTKGQKVEDADTSKSTEKLGDSDANQAVGEEWELGEVIMPKMANETARAILGRSTWHFLHVLASKYPDTPTPSDRHTLKSFISLFSQLYPCGDCARHFQQLIKEFPPDLTNRTTVVQWTCEAHNRVNVRLGKEVFDCEKVKVDCGCGPEEETDAPGDVEQEGQIQDAKESGGKALAAKKLVTKEPEQGNGETEQQEVKVQKSAAQTKGTEEHVTKLLVADEPTAESAEEKQRKLQKSEAQTKETEEPARQVLATEEPTTEKPEAQQRNLRKSKEQTKATEQHATKFSVAEEQTTEELKEQQADNHQQKVKPQKSEAQMKEGEEHAMKVQAIEELITEKPEAQQRKLRKSKELAPPTEQHVMKLLVPEKPTTKDLQERKGEMDQQDVKLRKTEVQTNEAVQENLKQQETEAPGKVDPEKKQQDAKEPQAETQDTEGQQKGSGSNPDGQESENDFSEEFGNS